MTIYLLLMFWVGLVVASVGAVLMWPYARDRLVALAKRFFAQTEERLLTRRIDTLRFVMVTAGLVIGVVSYQKSQTDKRALRDTTVALQRQLQPRHLSLEQRVVIPVLAREVGGLPAFEVHSLAGDAESFVYLQELVFALADGGCDLKGSSPIASTGDLHGVFIMVSQDRRSLPEGAARLARVLERAGIHLAPPTVGANLHGDEFYLMVTPKAPEPG